MTKIKKGFAVVVTLLLLLCILYAGQMFMINSRNFYALEANNVKEANEALKNMDILEERSFETKDFYGEYIPGTSFVISHQGRVYYDQGYYMVYKGDYKPVYCIDPLKTAWSVTNKDTLDSMNNHGFSKLSSVQQETVSRLVLATQNLYSSDNDPKYLVAGQLLVWEAIGSVLENYSVNLQEYMDKVKGEAIKYDFSQLAKGSTIGEGLTYYDTQGQDLIGTPTDPTGGGDDGTDGICDETIENDPDCDNREFANGDIEVDKVAELTDKETLTNGQKITYKVVVKNNSTETINFEFVDKLSDENLSYIGNEVVSVNGLETELTINDIISGTTVKNLTAGDSVEFEYTVTLDFAETYEEGELITNTAEACIKNSEVCDKDIETLGGGDITDGLDDEINAEKSMEEESGDGIVQKGEKITFKILVSNSGEEEKTVVVTDELNDVNIVYDLAEPVYVDGVKSDYVVGDLHDKGIQLESIKPGEEKEITFVVEASEEFIFDTNAEMLVSNKSQVCIGEKCLDIDTYLPVGGFDIEKTVLDANGNGIAEPNETLTYNVKIENYNSEVSDITIKDNMSTSLVVYNPNTSLNIEPEQTTVPSPATLDSLKNGLTLKDVKPGEVINISYNVTTLNDLSIAMNLNNNHISNNVTICNGEKCLDDSASITIDPNKPVIGGGDKTVIKNASDANGDGIAQAGEKITFSVMLTNSTEENTLFTVKDQLTDDNLDYDLEQQLVALPGSGGSFATTNPTVQNLQSDTGVSINVNANSNFEFSFKATVKKPLEDVGSTFVYNSIQACSTEGCKDGGAELPLESTSSFEISKKVIDASQDGVVEKGEEFGYTIEVTNKGNSTSDFYLQDLIMEKTLNVDIPLNQKLSIELPEGVTVSESNAKLSDLIVTAEELIKTEITDNTPGIKFDDVPVGEKVTVGFEGTGLDEMIQGSYVLSNVAKAIWGTPSNVEAAYAIANIYTNEEGGGLVEEVSVNKASSDKSGNGLVEGGEEINYTVTLTNPTSDEKEIEMKDLLQDDKNIYYDLDKGKFKLSSSDGIATATSNKLSDLKEGVTITLGPQSVANIKYSGVAKNPAEDNSAIYDYNIVEYCVGGDCDSTISVILREGSPEFDVIKTAVNNGGLEITDVVDGQKINYEIVISNKGNITIGNLKIKDFADDNIIVDRNKILSVKDEDGNSIETTPSKIRISDLFVGDAFINKLEIGQKAIITIPATISYDEYSNENSLITNIVKVCDDEETCMVDDATISADPSNPVEPGDVGVVKEITEGDPSDGVGMPGEILTFKVRVSNSYPQSKVVTIQDSLDSINVDYGYNPELIIRPDDGSSYTLDDLKRGFDYEVPAKSVIELEFKAKIKSEPDFDQTETEITNTITACIDSSLCSEGGGHIVLPASAGFSINKEVKVNGISTSVVSLGDDLKYDVTVKNIKNTAITNLTLYDKASQFIEIPSQTINIIDQNSDIVKMTAIEDLMDEDGTNIQFPVDDEFEPGETLHFTYNANVALDLHGSDVNHLTSVAAAQTIKESSRNDSFELTDGSLLAVDSATVTLDSTTLPSGKFSILKTVKEENEDGIAKPGEKLFYEFIIINLTEEKQFINLIDKKDVNINYNPTLTVENIPASDISPTNPTVDDLLSTAGISIKIPAMQYASVKYSGEVQNPLADPSASFISNYVEACNAEGDCSDSSTETALDETKGFDVVKDVIVKGESPDVVDVQNGDILEYAIRIKNNRNTDLSNVVVKDIIDKNIPVDLASNYTIESSLGESISVRPATKKIEYLMSEDGIKIAELKSGDTVTISFESLELEEIEKLNYNHLTNIAEVCAESASSMKNQVDLDEASCGVDSATVTIEPSNPPVGNISIIKEVTDEDALGNADGVAAPGETLHFKFTITNNSEREDVLTLTDEQLDPNINLIAGTRLTLTPSDTQVHPTNPTIEDLKTGIELTVKPSRKVVVEFDGEVSNPLNDPTASMISNEATICNGSGDCTDGGGNLILPKVKGFKLDKTVAINDVNSETSNPGSYVVHNGDKVTYTIELENNRNDSLLNVLVQDEIADGLLVNKNQKLVIDGVESTHMARELFEDGVNIDEVNVGQVVTIKYTATADTAIEDKPEDEFTNFVKACTTPTKSQAINTPDGFCGYDAITITTDNAGITDPEGKVGVVKQLTQDVNDTSLEPDLIHPGELITFDILVYNNSQTSEEITIRDELSDPNIDYDAVLADPLNVSPVGLVMDPTTPKIGGLKSAKGVKITLPGESYVNLNFEVRVKDKLTDTSADSISNVAVGCLPDGNCSEGGTSGILEGNKNFKLSKTAYSNGHEISNTDILNDGDRVDYEIRIENTGNRELEDITFSDLQDDNLITDYEDVLEYDESLTTQTDFDMSKLEPANPKLKNLFYDQSSDGITIKLLDPGSVITFNYSAYIKKVTDTEEEATNMITACAPSALSSKTDATLDPTGSKLCATDYAKVSIKDHSDNGEDVGVVKFAVDSGVGGIQDGLIDPGEGIDYTILVQNNSDEEVKYNVKDTPDSNIKYEATDEINVSPNSYAINKNYTVDDLVTGKVKLKLPPHESAIISYHAALKTIDEGVDTVSSVVSNAVKVCDDSDSNECGSGDANLPISTEKFISIQKDVRTQNETDDNGDGINEVTTEEPLTYTIITTNKGNIVTDVRVKDDFPEKYLDIIGETPVTIDGGTYETEPVAPKVSDLIGDGVVVKEVEPGDSFSFKIMPNVKTAGEMIFNGEPYEGYIVNMAEACTVATTRIDEKCSSTDASVAFKNSKLPIEVDFSLRKRITDESGNGDGIAQPGEELTFYLKLLNDSAQDEQKYIISDEFEDLNMNYSLSNMEELEKVDGAGEFIGSHYVGDLIDEEGTTSQEGVAVQIDSHQFIEFKFTAKVSDPLSVDSLYNSQIINTIYATDEVGNINTAKSIIDLPLYNRMDITKTYTTDYTYDKNPDPSVVDKVYYVQKPGDIVTYNVNFKNIGSSTISNFVIKDVLDTSSYTYDPSTTVKLTTPSANSTINLEQLLYGYTYTGSLGSNETLIASFDVMTTDLLLEKEDGYRIPNIAKICYENTFTEYNTDQTCRVSGVTTPLDKDGKDVVDSEDKFTIEKWIEDSDNGKLEVNEDLIIHILVSNNTDDDLSQFDLDGENKIIEITDDLIDPNIVYDLETPLNLINVTNDEDVTNNSDVVNIADSKLKNIDRSSLGDILTLNIKDGEAIEITFSATGADVIV